ncbi:MAG: hypothetical protein ABI880_09650 [Acidobacteriota bacterium]
MGIACPRPGERAAVADWLRAAEIEPVMLVEACFVNADVAGKPLDCVVADAALLTPHFLSALRKGDPAKVIIALGEADDPNVDLLTRRGVSFHVRPASEKAVLLAVSLAVVEGRPNRRSPRRAVPRLESSIDGEPVVLLDVSHEGLRLEMAAGRAAKLSPQFVVHVPVLKMGVPVQRVWLKAGEHASRLQCGASLLTADDRTQRLWQRLSDPAAGWLPPPKTAPARVSSDRFLGRVGQMLAAAPIVGSLTQLPWRGRS